MSRPLVGQRCRLVARPERGGRVIDVAPMARQLLVELDAHRGEPSWWPFEQVEAVPDREEQGHDAHLDAIEAALARPTYDTERSFNARHAASVPYSGVDNARQTIVSRRGVTQAFGSAEVTSRTAFVPKGGA